MNSSLVFKVSPSLQISPASLGFDPVAVVRGALERGDIRAPAAVVTKPKSAACSSAAAGRLWRLNHPKACARYAEARRFRINKNLGAGLRFDGRPRKRRTQKQWRQLRGLNAKDYARQYRRLTRAVFPSEAEARFGAAIRKIQLLVAEFFKVPVDCMWSSRRPAEVVWPRHVAMFLCRRLIAASSLEVGFCFGGRDHSTVLYAEYQVRQFMAISSKHRSTLKFLMARAQGAIS